MDQVAMSKALTEFAVKRWGSDYPNALRHTIVITKNTKGGDMHLNGKRIVRVHPELLTSGLTLGTICDRVFTLIREKPEALRRLRERSIVEAQTRTESDLGYLSRYMEPDDYQRFVEDTVGLT